MSAPANPDPAARIVRRARRVVVFLALAGVLYAAARFDVVRLPSEALSPLHGIHPGDRLLVDRHARAGAPQEVWLYRGASGELLLGRAGPGPDTLDEATRHLLQDGALWMESERDIAGAPDSRTLGPIARDALVGRVVLVLPW